MSDSKKRKKSKKGQLILLAVLIVAAGSGGGYWYWEKSQPVDYTQIYTTAPVTYGNVSETVTGEARVETADTIPLFLETPQDVATVYVKEGDRVTEGQLLVDYNNEDEIAELERRLSEAYLYANNANLSMQNIGRPPSVNEIIQYENAVVNAEKAITDLQYEIESLEAKLAAAGHRARSARETANIAEDEYDDDEIDRDDYDVARANYRAAQAEQDDIAAQLEAKRASIATYEMLLESAKLQLENVQNPLNDPATVDRYQIQQNLASVQSLAAQDIQATIAKYTSETLSPVDGVVLAVNVLDGGAAGTTTAVVEIANKEQAVVRFEVPEFDAPRVALGQKASITVGGIEGKVYTGNVTKIYEQAIEKVDSDDDKYIVPVEITLQNADAALKIGYTVNVELMIEQRRNVLYLPLGVLFPEGEEYFVYVIVDGALQKKQISTGFIGDRSVEVLDGLDKDDVVVLNPGDVDPKHISTPVNVVVRADTDNPEIESQSVAAIQGISSFADAPSISIPSVASEIE